MFRISLFANGYEIVSRDATSRIASSEAASRRQDCGHVSVDLLYQVYAQRTRRGFDVQVDQSEVNLVQPVPKAPQAVLALLPYLHTFNIAHTSTSHESRETVVSFYIFRDSRVHAYNSSVTST